MEIWNINGGLDKAIERFKDLTTQEICDKIVEFAYAKDDSSFDEARLALADRLNSMRKKEINALKKYVGEKVRNGFQEYLSIIQVIEIKHLYNIIDKMERRNTRKRRTRIGRL